MYKLVIVLMLVAVIASLASGLYFVFRDGGQGRRAVLALSLRIALSIAVFVVLFVASRHGWRFAA